MKKLIALVTLALGALLCQAPAHAIAFKATLTSGAEVPPILDEGSGGIGTFVLNDAQTRLTYDVLLFGLDLDGLQTPSNAFDSVTRAHFHNAAVGVNGGIVFGIIDTAPALTARSLGANGIRETVIFRRSSRVARAAPRSRHRRRPSRSCRRCRDGRRRGATHSPDRV